VDQAETGGPAVASAVLQPLPAFAAIADAVLQPLSAVLQLLPAFCSQCHCQFRCFAAGEAANFAAADSGSERCS